MNSTHALHTDLYQLTMMAAYFHNGKHEQPAVCELFVRRLPKNRRFLLAAGLERCLEYISGLRFTDAQIESMKEIPSLRDAMTPNFVEYLRAFRFTGNVWAVPEGTVMFQNEPFVRETFLLSCINHQTMVASKAARIVLAAGGRPVLEFGSRRTHYQAAVDVARAAYIAGFEGSSNVEAFYSHDIPARGTMAHMFIMSNGDERDAFREYGNVFGHSSYLVDTYDTIQGVKNALDVVGEDLAAVRLDSGDLAQLSKDVRALLKERGREDVKIFLSSDLDEYELVALNEHGDYDGAGIGTRLATSHDSPSLGGVYKLVQIGKRPVAKFSEGKVTLPGRHQIYRQFTRGLMVSDYVGGSDEGAFEFVGRVPLLIPVMQKGSTIHSETVHAMRARAREQLSMLPDSLRTIEKTDVCEETYAVRPSRNILALLEECRQAQLGTQ